MSESLTRIVEFTPAFDKRHADSNKDYGIGAVMIRFVLKGPRGATQFLLSSAWYLPHVARELWARNRNDASLTALFQPMAMDLGYHSPIPQYEGQLPMGNGEPCQYLDGKPCYYDGSGLNAEPVLRALLKKGDAGVWTALEQHYIELFGAETSA